MPVPLNFFTDTLTQIILSKKERKKEKKRKKEVGRNKRKEK
jgi:hypothetical protein